MHFLALQTAQLVTSAVVLLLFFHIALVAGAYFILLERKLSAWVQDRVGPNRVGPMGLLQPIADGIKLFFKEEFRPRMADRMIFFLAPGLAVIPAIMGLAIIPWAGSLELSDLPFMDLEGQVQVVGANVNIGVIFLIATGSLGVYGVGLGGWASNNKYSFLGGLRAAVQMISYEIPMGLALLCVILTAGSLRPDEIIAGQIEHQWYILHQPIIAILFYICLLAEANRAPFDLAEAESELVGGWHTEYSSMKWAMFFLGEYMHIFVGSAFFAVLFLGGWSINPFFGADLPMAGGIGMILLQVGVMLAKVFLVVSLTMMVRWTLPRFRFDQLMRLAWEGMIPVSMLLLLVTSFYVFCGWEAYLWTGSLGALGIIMLLYRRIPRTPNPNARIGLIGSRFSPARPVDPGAS